MIMNIKRLKQKTIAEQYGYWRFRILYSLIFGYASFYLIRQNFQVAAPRMLSEFGCTRSDIGWGFSAFAIVYGFGKFINGAICDKTNARYFMTIGLIGSAVCSLFMGFADSLWLITLLYAINGIFQSAGWPPIARLMTQWYSPTELGTRWGTVNASHQIGSIVILICGSKLLMIAGWRFVFIVPAIVTIFVAFILFERLRDNPKSLGLPSVEEFENLESNVGKFDDEDITFKEIFMEHILPNKALWYVCMSNFFLYIIRMGFFNWAPTFLQEAKGASIMSSAMQNTGFELMGALGGFLAGWASDKVFGGRRNCTSFYFVVCLIILLFLFRYIPYSSSTTTTIFLFVIGFFVYGPQTLIGIAGAEFGSRRASAAANGLTGTFGYLGGAVSGFGIGKIADNLGWNAVFLFLMICAICCSFFLMLNWSKTNQVKKHTVKRS